MVTVKELLLGDNPFIGVSHLAQEKAREERKEATLENMVKVIEAAIDGGANGFTFSTHPSNLELLRFMKKHRYDILQKLNYYVLVPYAAAYIREATKVGTAGLLKRSLSMLWSKLILNPSPPRAIALFIEAELRDYLRVLPISNLKAVLLHEVLSELITAFRLDDVIKEISSSFKRKNIGFGLETRNIARVKEFLDENRLSVDYIMTPLNPLGYQMTPTREEAEYIINNICKDMKIIAINVLASGALNLDEVIKYLIKFKSSLYAIAIGTSKPWRASYTFKILSQLTESKK